ncbi:hypothetical protein JYU34_015274 [Plutella xylostella]|uniref:C2H2-type domain-containing protein n=1 Tax=Plutella xylostella TaxID=51655 RepID=A0ABQ7Q6R0_PLUXY|nr:hypothetical protein JYU34_015274 [Plutella xylostella]
MSSPPANPSEVEEGGAAAAEEPSGQQAPAAPKTFIAPPASQLPSKLQYVAVGAPGPSGIKQCFRTVKAARRVPTLPPRAAPAPAPAPRRARRDRNKRHACTTCDKRFSSPGKLSQHVLAHTGELPFSCDLCEKKFNSKFKLVRHSLIHSEARAFACTVCGKTFNRKDHLTNHVRVHNPVKKLFSCDRPDCRKSYTSLLSYRKHAALHSAEEGNLQCEICDDTFSTRQEIVYHLKVHTGSRTVKNEMDKKFTCDFCQRRFFTAKDVRRHLVVHTGRRDFLCPYCPQKFGRKDHLVRHVKNAHPEESWRSAAVGTSSEPALPDPTPEETFPDPFSIESSFEMWKPGQGEESEAGRTRVPSSEIIVEMPEEHDIKDEPLEVKLEDSIEIKIEEPASPACELLRVDFPVVYIPQYPPAASDLPFMTAAPLVESLESHILDPGLLLDPGEGPSGLSSQILRNLLEGEYGAEETRGEGREGRAPQRLPAFTQAFHTAQSPKPPPPPPPPH